MTSRRWRSPLLLGAAALATMVFAHNHAGASLHSDVTIDLQPARPAMEAAMVQPMNDLDLAYQKAWMLLRDNYVDRDKLQNWNQWQHKFDGKLASRDDLVRALRKMFGSLGDDYTYVLSERQKQARTTLQQTHASVESKRLADNVGYISISNFEDSEVPKEFGKALDALRDADGFVLDLRNNHGGFITSAQSVFSMMTNKGLFTSYMGYQDGAADAEWFELAPDAWHVRRNGVETSTAREQNLIGEKPLVVLVNKDTRSAAEMLAGALRDNGRATVLGTQTFGKGVLQDTFDLTPDISVKIVTARYFLPSGRNIHNRGLRPDVQIADADAQLQSARATVKRTIAATGTARL